MVRVEIGRALRQVHGAGVGLVLAGQLDAPFTFTVERHGVVVGQHVIGVGFEEVHLLLQLERVDPVIVALAIGDVLAAGPVEQRREAPATQLVLVVLMNHRLDEVRVLLGVALDDLCGAVAGGVVVDQDLEGERGALRQEAVQGLLDVVDLVVGRASDRQQRLLPLWPGLHDLLFGPFHRSALALLNLRKTRWASGL